MRFKILKRNGKFVIQVKPKWYCFKWTEWERGCSWNTVDEAKLDLAKNPAYDGMTVSSGKIKNGEIIYDK